MELEYQLASAGYQLGGVKLSVERCLYQMKDRVWQLRGGVVAVKGWCLTIG